MTWILLLNDMRQPGETVSPVARAESREALDTWEKSLRVPAYQDGDWMRTYPLGSPLEWYNAPLREGTFMNVGTEESTVQRALEFAKRQWQNVLAIPEIPR